MSGNRRNPQPLDGARLEELGLAYVARFATTQARLEAYLVRKLRERGWAGEGAPDPAALARRMVDKGFVDDAVYSRIKAGSLLRRGYGARRVGEALRAAGVAEDVRGEVRPEEGEQRRAALTLARRRRFGPFASERPDRPGYEKQVAAMLRAGHTLDIVRQILDASDPEAAEQWAESADGDAACD